MKSGNGTPPSSATNGSALKNCNPNPLILKCEYRDREFEHWPRPSELELAMLAAQLAHSGKVEPKRLVATAWEVYWESCRTLQADYQKVEAYFAREAALEAKLDEPEEPADDPLPMPEQFPLGYRELELLLMPRLKGRTAERAKRIRTFLFLEYIVGPLQRQSELNGSSPRFFTAGELDKLREESKAQLDQLHEQLRATPLGESDYGHFARQFLTWDQTRARFANSLIRSAVARQAWAKRKRKKKAKRGARPKYEQLREIIEP